MRGLLCARLRMNGYEAVEAKDGTELAAGLLPVRDACPTSPERAFDLVVSDVRMPGRSGLDVLHEVGNRGCAVPFILITAFGDRATHEHARRLGAAAVFDKPFDLDELCTAVENVLRPE